MINDPIVEEVRKSRREILESYGALRAYHNAILEKQTEYADRLVTLSPEVISLTDVVSCLKKIEFER